MMHQEERQVENNVPAVIVKKIKFNNGVEYLFNRNDIVIFVGANNVGKSRALKDLRDDLNNIGSSKIVIDSIEYAASNFTTEAITKYFENNYVKNNFGNYDVQISESHTHSFSDDNFRYINSYDTNFYKVLYSFLSTDNRLKMSLPNNNYGNDIESLRIMQHLNDDLSAIIDLNNVLEQGFKKGIEIIDNFGNGGIGKKYKIASSEEIGRVIEASKREGIKIMHDYDDLHEQGDGIRSAVAILSSLIVNTHSLFLIDEPETFLHPPQARILGRNLVELSKNKQCFISTHNIDLIRGIVEIKSSRVKIIKINREGSNNEFHLLKNEDIEKIAEDRNLKYTNILNGLFYQKLVLCENESDCKFYSAILEAVAPELYQATLFCAVGGKDQFKIIMPILKRLHIDHLVIADIDLINDKDKLSQLLNAVDKDSYSLISSDHEDFLNEFNANTSPEVRKQEEIKKEINSILTNGDEYLSDENAKKIKGLLKRINNFKVLKTKGIDSFPTDECKSLFEKIKRFLNNRNIYILECGEIEGFVSGVDKHGNGWVESVFEQYQNLDLNVYDKAKEFIHSVFLTTTES